ncbi:hypothetical protein HOLleu_38851 [Holothuria leucospilota]|uniref:Uncharacterized protein n=1 Tax=Holothuria leucospilota TaxID=206669 RepID=A0A9Q0YMI9_HOLLE|nr:hypothetical protein HOLleu_38851 [Holothuria leucospilota]
MRRFVFVCLVVLSTLLAQAYSNKCLKKCQNIPKNQGSQYTSCVVKCGGQINGKRTGEQMSQLQTPRKRYGPVSIDEILRRLIE